MTSKASIMIIAAVVLFAPMIAFAAPPSKMMKLPVLLSSNQDCLPTLQEFVSKGLKAGKWKRDKDGTWVYTVDVYDKQEKKNTGISLHFARILKNDRYMVWLYSICNNGKYSDLGQIASFTENIANSLDSHQACLAKIAEKKKMLRGGSDTIFGNLGSTGVEADTAPSINTERREFLWDMPQGKVYAFPDAAENGTVTKAVWLEMIYNEEGRKGLEPAIKSRSKYSTACTVSNKTITREALILFDGKGQVVQTDMTHETEIVVPGTFGAGLYKYLCPKKKNLGDSSEISNCFT